jgi:hypothetical protein
MKKTAETLPQHPTWSFTENQDKHWSGLPKHKRQSFQHYQKCISAANYDFLKKQCEGFTINFCCGLDTTGDVKVDIDRETVLRNKRSSLANSDFVVADVRHPPFIPLCCDTLLADPPFSLYARFKWILNLKDLARNKVIISHPCTNLKLAGFTRELYFINSKSIFLRLWWVYTRQLGG